MDWKDAKDDLKLFWAWRGPGRAYKSKLSSYEASLLHSLWLRFQFADACRDSLEVNAENKLRRRCAHEGEDLPMKGKMSPLKGRCAHEREDMPMKGKMCP